MFESSDFASVMIDAADVISVPSVPSANDIEIFQDNQINALAVDIMAPSQITRFMRPTWGPPGANSTQMVLMLAPWTLLSGLSRYAVKIYGIGSVRWTDPWTGILINYRSITVEKWWFFKSFHNVKVKCQRLLLIYSLACVLASCIPAGAMPLAVGGLSDEWAGRLGLSARQLGVSQEGPIIIWKQTYLSLGVRRIYF